MPGKEEKEEEGRRGRRSRKRKTRTRNKTDSHITISSPSTHSKRNYQRGSVQIATRSCGRAFRTLRGTCVPQLEKQTPALLTISSSDYLPVLTAFMAAEANAAKKQLGKLARLAVKRSS